MINFDEFTGKNKQKHNLCWLQILVHPYRILIRGSSRLGKMNVLLKLKNHQPGMDNIYLYVKDPHESNY